jgi:CDP-diacylglycerol---glycerol-3-phosphate 3-phosphatidyltransferase
MSRSETARFYCVQGLTLLRVPLVLTFLGVAVLGSSPMPAAKFCVALAALLLSALTDLLDGYFARKLGVTSRLGGYLDPLLDKVFYLTAFPALIYLAGRQGENDQARLLLALTVLFLLRDQWVSFLRSLGALHSLNAAANWSGKARTLISFPTICAIYYYLEAPKAKFWQLPAPIILGMEWVSLLINVVSIVVYTRHFLPALRKEMRGPGSDPGSR